jgi:hypothetical protein
MTTRGRFLWVRGPRELTGLRSEFVKSSCWDVALSLLWGIAAATAASTPVRHRFQRAFAASGLDQRPGELLLLLDDRLEEIA